MRRQYKLAEIARLNQEIAACDAQLAELRDDVADRETDRLKSGKDLQEAMQAIAGYLEGLSELQSDWREYRQRSAEAKRYEEEATHQAELAEWEEEQRDERIRGCR